MDSRPICTFLIFVFYVCGVYIQMCIFRREGYSNFLFFAYFFYLSKFYEVFDTIILMVKGTRPELLQTYHHAGIVTFYLIFGCCRRCISHVLRACISSGAMIGMWWALNADSPGLWFFVCENAFVHAIMYFYYAMSTIGITLFYCGFKVVFTWF